MNLHGRLIYIFAALITLLVERDISAATLTVLQTFDFPGHPVATAATMPQKISDQGDLIGTVIDVTGTAQAFIYKYRIGKFSAAFHAPNDTGHDTQGRGINNLRHSCGEYLNASHDTYHGYVLEHPDFIDFDIADALDTIPLGINNAGDLAGTVVLSDGTQQGFLNLNRQGVVVTFEVPDATATFAYQVNALHQIIGYYIDANGISHCFWASKQHWI